MYTYDWTKNDVLRLKQVNALSTVFSIISIILTGIWSVSFILAFAILGNSVFGAALYESPQACEAFKWIGFLSLTIWIGFNIFAWVKLSKIIASFMKKEPYKKMFVWSVMIFLLGSIAIISINIISHAMISRLENASQENNHQE